MSTAACALFRFSSLKTSGAARTCSVYSSVLGPAGTVTALPAFAAAAFVCGVAGVVVAFRSAAAFASASFFVVVSGLSSGIMCLGRMRRAVERAAPPKRGEDGARRGRGHFGSLGRGYAAATARLLGPGSTRWRIGSAHGGNARASASRETCLAEGPALPPVAARTSRNHVPWTMAPSGGDGDDVLDLHLARAGAIRAPAVEGTTDCQPCIQ